MLSPRWAVPQAGGYDGSIDCSTSPHQPIKEAACCAHVRRKFYGTPIKQLTSPIALDAFNRIAKLYAIEEQTGARSLKRDSKQVPHVLRPSRRTARLDGQTRANLSKKSDFSDAIHYALSRRRALTRYREDGRQYCSRALAARDCHFVAEIVSSQVRMMAANAPPSSARSSAQRSSTVSIQNVIYAAYSSASTSIQSSHR